MASDARDVLNLSEGGAGPRQPKKSKAPAPRPNLKGLAREVHMLSGDSPLSIISESKSYKKRRWEGRKPAAHWELRPFRNSAREDQSLILHHWRRKEASDDDQKGASNRAADSKPDTTAPAAGEIEDSAFAKFNVQVSVPQYNDDQYRQHLQSSMWSKEETDYLMGLVADFEIRWPLIWDRYEWSPPATNGEANVDGEEGKAVVPNTQTRSMEDLKARYYEVASKMMAALKPVQYMSQSEFALHEMMAKFDPEQEKARKEFALKSFSRSREEAREEEFLLLEIKRMMARSDRFNEERKELYNRLDYPRTETDIGSFKSSAGLQTLMQNLVMADKNKKRKSLAGADGTSPATATGPQSAHQESGRRDSSATLQGGGHRDSTGALATPSGGGGGSSSRKAQQQSGQQASGQQPPQQQERRKLTAQEEAIYGVTHFDRLGSGPAFRTEKINKLFSHKSNQQQTRILNALNELDVPNRLVMATAATTMQYEQLFAAVNSLLEARKLSDKLDAEIKLERAKKAEREKAKAPPPSSAEATGASASASASASAQGQGAGGSGGDGQEEASVPALASDAAASKDSDASFARSATLDAAATNDSDVTTTAGTRPGAGDAAAATTTTKSDATAEAPRDGGGGSTEEAPSGAGAGGEAANKEKGTGAAATGPKRSASVLSTRSDKSVKRQKK